MGTQNGTIKRTFESTHPWIKFQLNLTKASYKLWMLLGEAQSKCQHVAGIPLLPKVAEYFMQVYLAKGVNATTAIEGNSLTEEEVMRAIDGKLEVAPSKEYLRQEVENIIKACNNIANIVLTNDSCDISIQEILDFNHLVLRDVPLGEGVVPGEIRHHSVTVGRYRAAPPEDCSYLLNQYVKWLNDLENELSSYKSPRIALGIIKAITAHLFFVWIHPFGDGNGRTARLIEFQILLSCGVPTNAAHLLSNHYNQTRMEYYRQLDKTHRSGGDILPFIEYALQGFVDQLTEQIEMIKGQQIKVHWVNFVHEAFKNRDSVAENRRRRLVLDLTEKTKPVSMSEIRHISPRIAESYAGKTEKTIQRDISDLISKGLVEKTKKGIRARTETMLAFMPDKRPVI
ncbi:MAG: Fic family protein [Anaerolineales bacterium]|nr:Fic family protein [Anaerolineales bacterium]